VARVERAPEVFDDLDRFYRFVASIDTAFLLAMRSEREVGYNRER
jgi:hypothetical protein